MCSSTLAISTGSRSRGNHGGSDVRCKRTKMGEISAQTCDDSQIENKQSKMGLCLFKSRDGLCKKAAR